jgi:lipoate-protein ligase B
MAGICTVQHLGVICYEQAWRLQEQLAAQIAAGERDPTLLLLEHPHTYTFGRRGQAKNLLWDEAELARRGVSVHWVDRGGDVTYHGPGQLVGYPLLRLASAAQISTGRLPQAGYLGYLRRLEQVLILALERMGVSAVQVPGLTGVWIPSKLGSGGPPAKIAAIGVKVDARGVSRHGFALNVAPEMSYWQGIVGCGLEGYPITSLERELPAAPAMTQVMDRVAGAFGEVFDYTLIEP